MRLIDAEPLVAISWKAHKDETYERGFEDGVCHALGRIEQAPTVDAIPVEWLEAHKMEYLENWGAVPIAVVQALTIWRKEQEG